MDYKYIAKSYTKLHKEEQSKKLNKIKEYLDNHKISLKNKKILDVGSGTGISTDFFEGAIGIEPEIEMIKQGSYNAIQASAENLPFNDHTFDVIISVTAIHNIANFKKAISEIKRVLKPRYLLIITLLRKSNKFEEIKQLIKKEFNVIEIQEEKDTILISNNLA